MAINDFDSHLTDVGNALDDLNETMARLDELLRRHNHNDYSTLITTDFDGRAVDKPTYDSALSSIDNLLNTWLTAGHGTNIDAYLHERP